MAVIVALVMAAALIAYAGVVRFEFVYDDHWTIVKNPWLAGPLGPVLRRCAAGLAYAADIPDSSRPAMIASTWLDRQLFGLSPAGFHVHSLVLYAADAALATFAILVVVRRRLAALVGGLVFALAPVHAEVVAAVNYREDLIAALGVLVPLVWLFRIGRDAVEDNEVSAFVIGVVWLVGLLAKEGAVVLLPFVLALALILQKDRVWIRARERTFVALASSLLLWGNWRLALRFMGADDVPRAVPKPIVQQLLATARACGRALANALAPIAWSPEHAREGTASWAWLVALGAIVAVVVILAKDRQTRAPAAGIALAVIGALPTSPLVAPINEQADRYMFLSMLGGAIVWGWGAELLLRRRPPLMIALLTLALALGLGFESHRAAAAWRDDFQLWSTAVRLAPAAPRAWVGMSHVHRQAGDLDTADSEAARAVELDPDYAPAHLTRAYNALTRGQVEVARDEIHVVERLAGRRFPGLAKARACAALEGDEAIACVGAR